MRTTCSEALPATAVIHGTTYVSDGGGGGTTTWAARGTVDRRVAPIMSAGEGERLEGDRIAPDADSIITLPFDAVVSEADRLVIAGDTYNVTAIRERSWNVSMRVEAKRLV